MKRSLILSNYRIAFRKKNATYSTEVSTLRWLNRFLDELSIVHSSQLRRWQIDYFVSRLKEDGFSYEELLQAKSALRFLFDKVLVTQPGIADRYSSDDNSDNPGSFRITA